MGASPILMKDIRAIRQRRRLDRLLRDIAKARSNIEHEN